MENITLTSDQEELIIKLDEFLIDNKLFFGVYGPAGSGKSFTITHFIQKNKLYDDVLLSGTTNNACRVLEKSIEKSKVFSIEDFIHKVNTVILNVNDMKLYIKTLNNKDYGNIIKLTITYLDKLHNFLNEIIKFKNENKIYKNTDTIDNEFILELKNKINNFINKNCDDELKNITFIIFINNLIENIYNISKYIKTIHSLLCFVQSRDENHNIIFSPSKSVVIEDDGKYNFYPKLYGEKKRIYNNMNSVEKQIFDNEYYKQVFSNLDGCKLLIIDESSMMKELEFRYIVYVCKILKIKIIFLGDKYQLPPVEDDKYSKICDSEILDEKENKQEIIDYSPAVKIKNSYTLSTIKRTSNPILQEVYKNYRDLVEKTSQGKIKLKNIQFIKTIQTTDTYLIKTKNEIHNIVSYLGSKGYVTKDNIDNFRILCFSNKEVDIMNTFMRHYLYGNIDDKYIKNEQLLITNYTILPIFDFKQLITVEYYLNNPNKKYFNYIFNKIINEESEDDLNDPYLKQFKLNLKSNNIKLYTSCNIKVIKTIDTQIYLNKKKLTVTIVFFLFENNISLFFYFKNKKDKEFIHDFLKNYKKKIKTSCDTFRLHKCYNCEENTCIHHIYKCEQSCKLSCHDCYECNPNCDDCIQQHKNNYSTNLWNDFIYKEYLLEPSVNYSYATTVHKSQGQSIDNIIVCEYNISNCILHNNEISEQQKLLIYPTCMYTAVTRSKQVLVRLK